MRSQISVKLRPNNQITITHGNWRRAVVEPYQNERQSSSDVDPFIREQNVYTARLEREYHEKVVPLLKVSPRAKLDIIQKSQRAKPAPFSRINKPKSFTNNSGQKVLESGSATEIAAGGDMRFCHEITLTLPANHPAAFKALAANSGYVINRLFQPIRRNYGEMCLWFFVWEYQERGALHLHICVYHPDETEGMWICTQTIEQWHKILQDVGERSQCDMFLARRGDRCTIRQNHQHHCQPITKSVAAYFAKYAGKKESKDSWHIQKYAVSRFWGSSKSIKEIIKENSLDFQFDYQGNEKEAIEKFESIIENIVEKLSIVSTSSYEFDIQLNGSHRLNRYQNGRKILSTYDGRSIAEGERFTFYFNSMELKKAMELMEVECSVF